MRTAERGQKIVKSKFVRQIGYGELNCDSFSAFAVQKIICSDSQIKQVSWPDTVGIVIVIFSPGLRQGKQC